MTVLCPKCRRALRVPPDKESLPGLKARCGGCGTVFSVAEASLALAPPAVPPTEPPPRVDPPPPVASPARPLSQSTPAAGAPRAPSRTRTTAGAWRRCVNHPSVPSLGVCSQCGKGWCGECVRSQGTASICPACDALCASTAEREAKEEAARMRARPLSAELGTVFRYPFSDKMGFVVMAVVVGVFSVGASLAPFGAGLAILLSQGLLYAYAFHAINRVSAGDLKSFMPEVGDLSDLAQPLRVGVAALLISTGPLLALAFLYPPASVLESLGVGAPAALVAGPTPTPEPTVAPEVQALLDEARAGEAGKEAEEAPAEEAALDEAAGEPAVPPWVFAAFALALVWKILYSPVALVAAAISRSFVTTINPVAGIDGIRRMGGVYWSAMGVYTLLAVAEVVLVGALGLIPLAGRFFAAFVQSYVYLAIGCLLGLAVFKKAPELGLD
jgi:hypothetical protein